MLEIPLIIEAIDKPCGGPAGTGANDASPGVFAPSYPGIGVPLGAEYGSFDGSALAATGGTVEAAEAAGAAAAVVGVADFIGTVSDSSAGVAVAAG